jgi:hypothetical protein
MISGYLHPWYAESLAEFGEPVHLPASGGFLLKRLIPGSANCDAVGPYPIFRCRDWGALGDDLENIGPTFVSLALVTDPFGDYDPEYLRLCFEDRTIPFKEHFVVDLECSNARPLPESHRRHTRKALQSVTVEPVNDPEGVLDTWIDLYANLVTRHKITGIAVFSRHSFERQMQVPGLAVFRAVRGTDTLGMTLWYHDSRTAYYHLGAYSERGYHLGVSYAIFAFVIQYFRDRGLRFLSLGAGAGTTGDPSDGLSRFKRGWATGTRTAYFCGRVFDRARYAELAARAGGNYPNFFPAYRAGELG